MGDIIPKTSQERVKEVLAEAVALSEKYSPEMIKEIALKLQAHYKKGGTTDNLPDEVSRERDGAKEFMDLSDKIEREIGARKDERMPLEAVDIVLNLGPSWWKCFPVDVAAFIANNLWEFTNSPYTREQGLVYVTQKLESAEPGKGWLAQMVIDSQSGGMIPRFDTKFYRLQAEKARELQNLGIPPQIIKLYVDKMEEATFSAEA